MIKVQESGSSWSDWYVDAWDGHGWGDAVREIRSGKYFGLISVEDEDYNKKDPIKNTR